MMLHVFFDRGGGREKYSEVREVGGEGEGSGVRRRVAGVGEPLSTPTIKAAASWNACLPCRASFPKRSPAFINTLDKGRSSRRYNMHQRETFIIRVKHITFSWRHLMKNILSTRRCVCPEKRDFNACLAEDMSPNSRKVREKRFFCLLVSISWKNHGREI